MPIQVLHLESEKRRERENCFMFSAYHFKKSRFPSQGTQNDLKVQTSDSEKIFRPMGVFLVFIS